MIHVTFRPLPPVPRVEGPRRRSPFKATYGTTLAELDRELRMLDAENVTIQVTVRSERMIRRDGWLQDRALVDDSAVVLSFDSKHGPLRYETAEFHHWQDNLRAIALGLEALRKVDRYGITKSGQQYKGWRELPSGDGPSPERGRELVEEHGSITAALKATHPDHGGDREDFESVQAYRKLQEAYHEPIGAASA